MKLTKTKIAIALTLTGAVLGGAALADHHKGGHDGERRMERAEQKFEKIDADSDGKVTVEEMKTFAAERFAKRDLDGDGIVTREDRKQMRINRRAERFAKIDADGDGMISQDEFTAHKPDRKMRGEGRGRGKGMRGHHGHHGGKRMHRRGGRGGPLTIQEAEARAVQRFEQLDSDGKGYVTLNDMKASRGRGHNRGNH